MAKPHRGKSLWNQPNHGRGICPVCGRTGVKLLYMRKTPDQQLTVCKRCRQGKQL